MNITIITINYFLFKTENALKSLTIDIVEVIQNAAQQLHSPESTEDEKIAALETIIDQVDNLDTANDFCKIGGLSVLVPALSSEYTSVRSLSASLVAELAQNNPYCQQLLLEADALQNLMPLLSDTETATNGIHAISCLVRAYEPCLKAFIEVGGLECLLGCLQQLDQEKIIIRSLFLLNSLCTDYPHIRDEVVQLKAVEQIISVLRPTPEFDVRLETALSTLCLLTDNSDAVTRCKDADLNLKEILEEIKKLSGNKPECTETIDYCQTLQRKIFDESPTDAADR